MPAYDYVCSACGERTEIICKISERPRSIECPCGHEKRRSYNRSDEAIIVVHDLDGPLGLKYARVQCGDHKPRNTTKGFSEGVYDATDGRNHDYSRYYLKNTPEIDPRVISKKENKKKKGG